MFMTRMALDVNRADTQQALSNRAIMQQAVDQAFNGLKEKTLWRVEVLNHRMHLLMLSRLRPTLAPAHQQYGYPGAFPSWETWDIDDELNELHPGMRLHFRLCAATCPPIAHAESLHRMAQETSAHQLTWLLERCGQWGFRFEEKDVEVLHSEWVAWSEIAEDAALLACHQATYDGVLTVTDAALFAQSAIDGIGECSRMGAGLITLDPVEGYRYV